MHVHKNVGALCNQCYMLCSCGVQAKVNPGVEVYAQLPRPEGVREGCMPYAAWKYMRQPFTSINGMC